MKKLKLLFFICIVYGFVFLSFSFKTIAGTENISPGQNKAINILNDIISYNLAVNDCTDVQSFIDRALPEKISGTAEWYILGLSQYGDYDFTGYRKALVDYIN